RSASVPSVFGRCAMRIPLKILIVAGGLTLGGCAYEGSYGGVGLGYSDYGYNDYGYYNPYYYGGFGYPYGGYGYGASFGWYGDYYYPGTGIYVYDRYRRPRAWSGSQQRYWSSRQRTSVPTRTV